LSLFPCVLHISPMQSSLVLSSWWILVEPTNCEAQLCVTSSEFHLPPVAGVQNNLLPKVTVRYSTVCSSSSIGTATLVGFGLRWSDFQLGFRREKTDWELNQLVILDESSFDYGRCCSCSRTSECYRSSTRAFHVLFLSRILATRHAHIMFLCFYFQIIPY